MTPNEWARRLLIIDTPEQVAINVANGRLVPWSRNLLQCTEDSPDVLDLGSGKGTLSAYLSLHGRKMKLQDFSQEALKFSSKVFEILGLKARVLGRSL